MIKIAITGATGMLGHRLVSEFGSPEYEVHAIIRSTDSEGDLAIGPLSGSIVHTGINLTDLTETEALLRHIAPAFVVNAAGLIKQRLAKGEEYQLGKLNADLPIFLGGLSERLGFRFINISTDCVFSGTRGKYTESDTPDCADEYGKTKLRGEDCGSGSLVLRTSIIGRELKGSFGLLEWFLSEAGNVVRGFKNAFFSGLSTNELARVVRLVIEKHPSLSGLYHVSGERISKADLLELINGLFETGTTIERVEEPFIDRSLDSSRFTAETGYTPPNWNSMLSEIARESDQYKKWRTIKF